MRRRAIEGVDKPVFYMGEECGYITEYSDTMLAMLANGTHRRSTSRTLVSRSKSCRVTKRGGSLPGHKSTVSYAFISWMGV